MQSFLQEVAADLYRRYGEDVSSLHILFPTRRARHFFIDALSHLAERPMWQPRWLTIDDLMQEVSGLHSGERIRLIAELYKVYSACHDEPFDKFYFWGEMLLNDFDTIDKYRVDADALFRNIYELKELESDVSYLTAEQLEVIRQFWANFTDGATLSEEKRRFLAVWRTLGDVYHGFRARLQRQGIAYGGMMQRGRAAAGGRFRFRRAAALCRGGIQCSFGLREGVVPFSATQRRNRFLLGLRRLLSEKHRPGGGNVRA